MASLNKRLGVLGKRLAAHLLRRTSYKVTKSRIESLATKTADQAVDELFTIPPLAEDKGPINFEDNTTYWLTDGPYANKPSNTGQARRAVIMWVYNEMLHDESIRHKMAMFFSGIFVTASEDEDWRMFEYWRLLQYHCIGNIKDLSHQMTLDNRMLRFLNNNVNKKWSPNENYAREFLELFTILKGEQVGNGNYTNYTEHDIQEAARILTGFTTDDFTAKDPVTGIATGKAVYNHHDIGNKQFSAVFNNRVIMGATDEAGMFNEYQEFVDMIFDKVETARAFVRRMYLYFVSDRITNEIEQDIIEPLALQLWTDGYNLENTLKRLLKSVHFFDEDDSDNSDEIIGGKIKSPLELYLSTITLFDANNMGGLNTDPLNLTTYAGRFIDNSLAQMGLPRVATSVEGYPGFFKSPSFSKNWVDTYTLPQRFKLANALLNGHSIHSQYQSIPIQVDIVQFIKDNFVHQDYNNQLLNQVVEIMLPEKPDANRMNYFEDKLIGGVTAVNWMFDWQQYLSNGDDSSVRVVLEDLFIALVGSPEFQTF